MDYITTDSSVHEVFQARMLKWVVIFSSGIEPRIFNPGIEPRSPALQVVSLLSEPQESPVYIYIYIYIYIYTHTHIIESLCSMPKTNTTLQINYILQ